MRHLNKTFLLEKGVFIGEKSYTYKTKSVIFKKLYSNYIFDFNQSSFYIKKAINIVSDIIENRGTILIYSRNLDIDSFILKNIFKINRRIIYISEKWIPGTINNYKTKNKYNIKKVPNVVVILNKSIVENAIILNEASCLSIPVILLLSSSFQFDLISYPIWGNNFNPSVIKLFLSFFYNSILNGLFKDKFLKVKNKIKLKKKKKNKKNVTFYKAKI